MRPHRVGPLWPWLLVLGLCVICDVRCASRQLAPAIAAQKIEAAESVQIVKRYIPEGPDRKRVVKALEQGQALLEKADEQRASAETARAEAEADAQKWRWLKYTAGAAVIAAVALGGFRLFRVFRPE